MADTNTSPETNTTTQKSSKKWLWIILGITLLLVGSGGGWYFFIHDKKPENNAETAEHKEAETEAAETESDEHTPPVFVELEPFTVNLEPDGQFLQATFNLQVGNEEEAKEVKLYMPHIRHRILTLLSGKTAQNLTTQEGKKTLITEIDSLIEQPFAKGAQPVKITDVLVTSFIIQ